MDGNASEPPQGQPADHRLEVLGLAGQGDDVVVRLALPGEVESERGQARFPVGRRHAVQAVVQAVPVGQEVVGQDDHALLASGGGPTGFEVGLQQLQVQGDGVLGQHERARQGNPSSSVHADVSHEIQPR